MSECFWKFTIRCPRCDYIAHNADGYSSDDWSETFAFSGYGTKNDKLYSSDYICPACSEKIDIDRLYREQLIELDFIDSLIRVLERLLPNVIREGKRALWDHAGEPDIEAVLYRYCLLFPQNKELEKLKYLYNKALYNRKFFTKFEPAYGTSVICSDLVPYKQFLEKIYLPDTVIQIGDDAFSGAYIKDLFLPYNVTSIGKNAFKDCRNLITVHTSNSLTEIGDYAFSKTDIRKFFFPEGIKRIGKYAFNETRLAEVFIPAECEEIGEGAFADCYDLEKVTISSKIKNIENLFESTADIFFLNESALFPDEPYLFKINTRHYEGYNKEEEHDLMINFCCSDAFRYSHREGSLYATMNETCLSACCEMVNDQCVPIGEFIVDNESGIKVTKHMLHIKVPNYSEWRKDGNFEKIKEIYSTIIEYAAENNFRKIAFPLWPDEWGFYYYPELLMHIKPLLITYNKSFEQISWYYGSRDFFYKYNTSNSLENDLKIFFHKIMIEII